MRLLRFAPGTVPPQYAGAFCRQRDRRAGRGPVAPARPDAPRAGLVHLPDHRPGRHDRVRRGLGMLVRRLGEVIAGQPGQPPVSLTCRCRARLAQQIQHAVHRRTGAAARTRHDAQHARALLTRMMAPAGHGATTPRPWWQLDQWNPVEDTRIPLRDHEPMGRYAVRFDRIGTPWLRRGLQWHCKIGLETGTLRWSTVHRRIVAVTEFDAFLSRPAARPGRGWQPAPARSASSCWTSSAICGSGSRPRAPGGQRLSPASVQRLASDVEQFYLFMHDNQEAAAAALAEPGWLRLGPQHARFYRRGETSRQTPPRLGRRGHRRRRVHPDHGRIALLGAPARRGRARRRAGHADPDAGGRCWAGGSARSACSTATRCCRWPPRPARPAAGGRPGTVARLRYQQTKIDGAPDTMPGRTPGWWRSSGSSSSGPTVSSPAAGRPARHRSTCSWPAQMNRNGDRPYSGGTLHARLSELARRLDVRDAAGALVDFNRTHRFRHTSRDQPAERRRADPRGAAVPRASDPGYDHALRADPAVHRTRLSSCATASSPLTPASSTSTHAISTTCCS